jgi:RNA polymerase sigma-70 factor, ECF subfamily
LVQKETITKHIEANWYRVNAVVRSIVANHDDMLDVVQEVFIKLHRHWNRLDDQANIGAWLSAVARTSSYDHLRSKSRESVVVQHGEEEMLESSTTSLTSQATNNPDSDLISKETRRAIRRCIDIVDSQYQEVVRRYYFENQKVADMARELAEPVGTIKWRLSRARALLKKEFLMSEIVEAVDLNPRFPRLHVGTIWGYNGPETDLQPRNVCGSLLAQQILLCINKQFKTAKDIGKAIDADPAYIKDHLGKMTEAQIISREGKAYRANCILFGPEDEKKVLAARGPIGRQTAETVARHIASIDRIGNELTGNAAHSNKMLLRWISIGILLLNRGLWRRIVDENPQLAIETPSRPDGGSWIFLPRLEKTIIPVEMGCNNSDNGNPDNLVGMCRYWNTDFYYSSTKQKKTVMPIIERLLDGPRRPEAFRADMEEDLAAAVEFGYVVLEDGMVSLNLPVFTDEDSDLVRGELDPIITEITRTVLKEYPTDAYSLLDSLGFSFAKESYPVRAHGLYTLCTLRSLSEMGVLKAPSKDRAVSWGVFVFRGKFTPMG